MFLSWQLSAQDVFPHTELSWSTISTDHFLVHYHQGTERFAKESAPFLESIYSYLSTLYSYTPDQKLSIILKDHDDYSNGAAYFYDNKIEIWVPALDFDLRGVHPWLKNVLTHELTHIFQMQVSMKWTRKIPAVYLQWLGYESERRPDVLYGYPNILVSYPISGFVVPAWFAEGTAQHNHPELKYDYWDSHRDMILRMHLLEGKPLTWEEMAVFGKTSLGNESSYNAGFSFVQYIGETYGEDKVIEIARTLGSFFRTTISGAIQDVLGKSGEEVYHDWIEKMRTHYTLRSRQIAERRTEGELIEAEGFGNAYPIFSRDGSKIYYVSNKGEDYFGLSSLVVYDRKTKDKRKIVGPVRSTISESPDGRYLYYARITPDNPHWSSISDIYRYDLKEEEEERLTYGWRAFSPTLSRDGTKLAFAVSSGGTMNIAVAELSSDAVEGGSTSTLQFPLSNYRLLTRFSNGEQVFTPAWSVDGKSIAFGFSEGHNQTVAVFHLSNAKPDSHRHPERAERRDSGSVRMTIPEADRMDPDFRQDDNVVPELLGLRGDSRNPHFSSDGNWLYFSWDQGGIFNIYRRSLHSGDIQKVTEVLGGAFYPNVDSTGSLVFARYDASGYKIAYLEPPAIQPPKIMLGTAEEMLNANSKTLTESEIRNPKSEISSFSEVPSAPARRSATHVGGKSPLPQDSASSMSPHDGPTQSTIDNSQFEIPQDSTQLLSRPYRSVFSNMSFFPLLRIDNYNESAKGLDVLKPGLYFASNEVLDKISLFGGAAVNRQLERDLFLIFQFRDALPIVSWIGLEPTLSLEIYNISRKTNTTFPLFVDKLYDIPVEIGYNLLEFDATLTQPFYSEHMTATLGYTWSRYNADLGSFFIPTVGLNPSFRNVYLIGNAFWLEGRMRDIHPTVDMAINPVGRSIRFRATYEANEYNRDLEYDVVDGILVPRYNDYRFWRWELNWNEHLRMPFERHTLNLSLRGGAITGGEADTIFHFYGGGMVGLRGYPFYSIEGTRVALAQIAYRFPLAQKLDFRLLHMYFTKLYASAFAEAGDAWTGGLDRARFRKDVGVELRLEAFSWYAYPTRFSFMAAYGLDEFERRVQGETIRYGKEWRLYFNILFDFDILEGIAERQTARMR